MKAIKNPQNLFIILVSIILFYLIGRYGKITTGLNITYVYLQYPLLCIISIIYGPYIGAITGFVGHAMIDTASGPLVWYSWVTGSGFLGLSLGFISKKWKLKSIPEDDTKRYVKTRIHYFLTIIGLNIVSFLLIAPVLEVIFYKATVADAFTRGLFIAFSNGLTSAIVTDIFFSSLKHTVLRRIVSVITLLDALILVSYGNMNIGSILLYIITIIFGLYLFFYKSWHAKIQNKLLRFIRAFILIVVIGYTLEILFLAAYAYVNKPVGDEKVAIVLGAGLDKEKPSQILEMRLDTAYDWYMEDTSRIIVTSGGQGDDEIMPEAEAMRNYLIAKGVPSDNILAECNSTTTYENFEYSKELLKENNIAEDTTIVIITNNFHCFRATGYAKITGLGSVKNLAAPTPVPGIIPNYLRESLAFMKYIMSLHKLH